MPFNPKTGVYEPDWTGTSTNEFDIPGPIADWLPPPIPPWSASSGYPNAPDPFGIQIPPERIDAPPDPFVPQGWPQDPRLPDPRRMPFPGGDPYDEPMHGDPGYRELPIEELDVQMYQGPSGDEAALRSVRMAGREGPTAQEICEEGDGDWINGECVGGLRTTYVDEQECKNQGRVWNGTQCLPLGIPTPFDMFPRGDNIPGGMISGDLPRPGPMEGMEDHSVELSWLGESGFRAYIIENHGDAGWDPINWVRDEGMRARLGQWREEYKIKEACVGRWDGARCISPEEDACLARGAAFEWDGQQCKDLQQECANKGKVWNSETNTCDDQTTVICKPEDQKNCKDGFHNECINNQWECVPNVTRTPEPPVIPADPNIPADPRDPNIPTDIYDVGPDIDDTGRIPYDPESFPITPPAWQETFTQPVADDPLSRMSNLALAQLIKAGGKVWNPLREQTGQQLSDIMSSQGYLPPTAAEEALSAQFGDVIEAGGQLPATALEAETQANLRDIIAAGGALPIDQQRRAMEIEAARSPLDILRQSQLSQGRASLAGRGLLGQGPETDYRQRLEQTLAPMYTQAAQEIELEEQARADTRYQNAMAGLNEQAMQQGLNASQRYQEAQRLQTEMALDQARRQDLRLQEAIQQSANLSVQESANLVNTINALAGIQQKRTDAAIQVLDRNIEWNTFLAEFGLKRDQAIDAMQQGRLNMLLPMIQQFMNVAAQAAQGFLPSD